MQPLPAIASSLAVSLMLVTGCGSGGGDGRVVARATAEPATGTHEGRERAATTLPIGADGGVLVDVAGLVRRPGVYRLAAGARVHEAIAAAGGARAGADLTALNRAAPLVDGQQVLVSARAASGGTGAAAGAATSAAAAVSINAADVAALDALPGIGPVTAQRIVTEREAGGPFAAIDDLDRVPGIGPATIEALRDAATT